MSRIVVRVEEHPLAGPGSETDPVDRRRFIAVCATDDCSWRSPYQVVKIAAQDEARYHREEHRRQAVA